MKLHIFKSFLITLALSLILQNISFAQPKNKNQTSSNKLSATVPGKYLHLSGFVAPHASLVIIGNGRVIRGTVADSNGNFVFRNLFLPPALSNLCFEVVDFKRLGESYSCISIPSNQSNTTVSNIFLPPTLGLNSTEVNQGTDVLIQGYSMPNAQITIRFNNNKNLTVQADSSGLYQYTYEDIKAGDYQMFAAAVYQSKNSEKPQKGVNLKALSLSEIFQREVDNIGKTLLRIIGSPYFYIPVILLLISIPILYRFFPTIYFAIFRLGRKKLHHSWFVGY